MIRRVVFFVLVLGTVGTLFFSACKTAEPANYTLTVTLGIGVTGTPAAGITTHEENDTVIYNYAAQAGYGNLTVTLDGAPVASNGVVTMNTNHTLSVTAIIDVRGTWTGLIQNSQNPSLDFYFECTFSGGVQSGSVQGFIESEGNANGNYTVEGNELTFSLEYYNILLTCTGSFDGPNRISGEWEYPEPAYPNNGTWQLER